MKGKMFKLIALASVVGLFATQPVMAGENEVVIGFAPSAYDTTDYFGQFDSAMREVLEKEGISFKVKGRAPLTPGDVRGHMGIVEDFITIGVDYIIFGPLDPIATVPVIRLANEAGIPLIIMNRLEPLPDDAGVDVMTYTGYSHRVGGEVLGQWALDNLLKAGDEAAIIYGNVGHAVSNDRGFPAKEIWEKAGVKVVFEQNTNWLSTAAYDVTERVLVTYPNIKLIYGVSSSIAMGAAEAVAAAGLKGKVDVLGFGSITPEIDMIWEGLIRGSIFRDAASNGRQAAAAIILREQGKVVPKSYGMDLVMVGSRDEILDAIPVAQLKPTKNWAEMEKALAAR